MASVRLPLAVWIAFCALVGAGSMSPEQVERHSVAAAGLAMDGDECEVDATGSGGLCHSSLSLRQLRSERRAEVIQASKVAAGERRAEATHEASEAAGRQHGNGEGNESHAEECKVAETYCSDTMTYHLPQKDCSGEDHCRVLDMSDYFHEVPKGEKWLCAPADRKCDEHVDLSRAMFQSVDAEVPEEYEDLGLNASVGGLRADSMTAWGGQTMTLYHTTSLPAAQSIVRTGFRPGRSGWCGGAIYFINSPHLKASKFGPRTHAGAILEAKVWMGRMGTHFNRRCKGYWDLHGTGVWAAKRAGDNSIMFNPGDGNEFIIWDPRQVLSVRIYQRIR